MKRLSFQDILLIHEAVIIEFGGLDGISDAGLVESAIESPFQTFDSEELFPSIEEKATRLAYGLVLNHGFNDGNKRVACTAFVVFLSLNNVDFNPDLKELETMFQGLANGSVGYNEFLDWLLSQL